MNDGTIAAIATPIGEGGIGIVRLSGPEAIAIADQVFRPKQGGRLRDQKADRLRYGRIVNPHSEKTVDEGLALVMRAPYSYTAEDVVELQCHGGVIVVQEVLSLCLNAGAQMAEPGEFTKRAFLNGRLDLSQAEAVIDIVRSPTRLGLEVAVDQLEGSLSRRIKAIQEDLYQITVQVEASIDFPEDDVPDVELQQIEDTLTRVLEDIGELLETADDGKILREGLKTVITGKPNVGKSSLLNTLLDENRALVTDIPGTTRDSIEELVNVRGVPLRLIDTAGIRESADVVERLGVARSLDLLQDADLVLHVLDRSEELTDDDFEVLRRTSNTRRIILINKVDLPPLWDVEALGDVGDSPVLEISLGQDKAEAVDQLSDVILRLSGSGHITSSAGSRALLTRTRHKQALQEAKHSLNESLETLKKGLPLDLIAVDLYAALEHLGEVTGETVRENILDRIFAQFCIGK